MSFKKKNTWALALAFLLLLAVCSMQAALSNATHMGAIAGQYALP